MHIVMKPIEGLGVAKVVDSGDPNFQPGDIVSGFTGWEEYSLIFNTKDLRKIQQDDVPLSYHLGLLGINFSKSISSVSSFLSIWEIEAFINLALLPLFIYISSAVYMT